ncbi:MAG: hypothetical protein ABSF50_18140 [Burkholderiaceae bacterium]
MMVNYEVNDPLNGKQLPVGQLESYIATQMELMQTSEVLLAVVDALSLTQNGDYADDYPTGRGTLREWVAKKVSANLVIYQGQMGSQLIYVTYAAKTPVEAAQVANAVVDVYKEQDHLRSTGPPAERAQRFAVQLNDLKRRVEQAQKDVTDFHQRNGLIDDETKTNVDAVLLANLQGRLIEAQGAVHVAQSRKSADQASSDQVLSSLQIQALKTQLTAQELRAAQLERVYTPDHPEVRDARSQIEVIQHALSAAIGGYSNNASANLDGDHRLEQSLQQAIAAQRASMLATSRLRDEAAKYSLELESAQTMYKRALQEYDQIMFSSGGLYTNVSVVSRARPPLKPSKPKLLTGLILGSGLAGLFALSIPVGLELSNRRVRCRDDLERYHGIPVLMELGRLPERNRT